MRVSVIICTYKRLDSVSALLGCLVRQNYKDMEVLVVDGSGDDSEVRAELRSAVGALAGRMDISFIASAKGLPLQRNVGLRQAAGDLIVFFDDDVTFAEDFIERAVALFARPDMHNVGGATAYDVRNHPQPVNWRWRLRAVMGTVPRLEPGRVDRLGRSIPIGFAKPFSGLLDVGYLAGFCMMYRAGAIRGLWFDERIPTYGGEDRDYSVSVGKRWRLVLCGDLAIEHHGAQQSRDSGVERTFQAGFGIGHGFAKNASQWFDWVELGRVMVCEFITDTLAWIYRPNRDTLLMPMARWRGFISGVRTFQNQQGRAQ
jgi:glycosyltransferase involved in cell wall biosynthesis